MRNRKYDEDDQKQKQIQQIRAKKKLADAVLAGGCDGTVGVREKVVGYKNFPCA